MAYDEGMFYRHFLPCLVLLLLPLGAVSAETPAAPAASHPPPSLADALAAMPDTSVADGSVVLTVSPDKVLPAPPADASTPDAAPPDDSSVVQTPATLADRYGRSLQVFSHVLALAPPTMTVLNTDPALKALPLGQLAGQHPETYLLGSLSPVQLRQAGTVGLAYADMTPDQQSLLHALLPEPLEIVPASLSDDHQMDKNERAAFDAQIKKVSGNDLFGSLRFHAYLTADFFVHAPVGYGIGDTQTLIPSTGAYKLPFSGYRNMDSRGKSAETLLKADVPDTPKPGDILWNRHDLERTVSLSGLTTVDALVQRLGIATHLELYADPHYGALLVLVRGDLKEQQPAGDVMQALALCVCGTWRRVGPAYVLTDDVQGLGTRQAFLAEIGQIWSNRLSEAGKDAGKQLESLDWLHSLSFVPGDIGALSPDQITTVQKAAGTNKGDLPWKSLPPALQEHLKDVFLHYSDGFPKQMNLPPEIAKMGDDMKAAAESVTPNTAVGTTINIRLAVELPGTGAMMLFQSYKIQPPKPDDDTAAKPDTSAPANSIVLDKPLRGVLCVPKTPDEAQAVVAKLVEMKMNTLFLNVFTGGRTYFPNDALPPASADAGGVLAAALAAAKPLHIAVYAVMDTLCWRKGSLTPHPAPWPSGFTEDLTVTGETPDHLVQRRYAARSLSESYDHPHYLLAREGTEDWASPLDPAVRSLLPALVRALAATPGLSGLVFQDTVPPGYAGQRAQENLSLGYALGNRLAYLRAKHLDPIDLSSGFGDMVMVNVSEENFFGHYDITIPTFGSQASDYAAWIKMLKGANTSLLAGCWQSAHAAMPLLPLLLRGERPALSVLSPWTDPLHTEPYQISPETVAASNRFTARDIITIPYGPDQQTHLGRFVGTAQMSTARGWGHEAGGEVFDLVTGGPPEHLVDTLDKLEALVKR